MENVETEDMGDLGEAHLKRIVKTPLKIYTCIICTKKGLYYCVGSNIGIGIFGVDDSIGDKLFSAAREAGGSSSASEEKIKKLLTEILQ